MENDGKGGGAYYLHIDGQRGSLDRQLAAFMDADGRGGGHATDGRRIMGGRARAVD